MKRSGEKNRKYKWRKNGVRIRAAVVLVCAAGVLFDLSGKSALSSYDSVWMTDGETETETTCAAEEDLDSKTKPAGKTAEAGEDADVSQEDADTDGQEESSLVTAISGTPVTEVTDGSEIVELINETWDAEASSGAADTSGYGLKRLMVLTDGEALTDSYGATDILYYDAYGEYVLQFETEADTKAAYYELVSDFGEDQCFVDEVITDDVLASYTGVTEYETMSWGGSYMGFGYLKAEYDYYSIDEDVTVAVIDTGVDTANSIFKNRIDTEHSFSFTGSDSVTVGTNYKDQNGHGTFVAGIIADSTPENVSLMILKAFDADGNSSNLAIRSALQYAVSKKADVVNMSFGWTGIEWQSSVFLKDVLKKAEKNGTIVCCAAGNERSDVYWTYPANCENVITVSAVNENGVFAAAYSNYGDTVDFAAPGTSVKSTYLDGEYEEMSGTSFSTPFVVSAVAYVKMVQPDLGYKGVISCLKKYTTDAGSYGWDPLYGWGCIDLSDFFDDSDLNLSQAAGGGQTSLAKVKKVSVSNQAKGVTISWKKVSNAANYRIYRRTSSGSWKAIGNVTAGGALSFTDTTAKAGKWYAYQVRARNGSDYGAYSKTVSIRRLKQPKITVKKRSYGFAVKWSEVKGASSYRIYRKTGSGSYKLIGTTTKLYWKDKTAKAGKTYSYKIKAVNGSFRSCASKKVTVTK